MKVYKILVVEDKREGQEKAEAALKAVSTEEVRLVTVGGLVRDRHMAFLLLAGEDAPKSLAQIRWDGVLTDLNFPDGCEHIGSPYATRGAELPWGMEVAAYCAVNHIPCVVCTDQTGHKLGEDATRWFVPVLRRLGVEIETDKDWEAAARQLLEEIQKKEEVKNQL